MKHHRVKIVDLMSTALVTVNENDSVTEAQARMTVGRIRHLPVVDDRGRLVGVLSDRDLLRTAASSGPIRIGEIMSRDVITIRSDAPAHQAVALMVDRKIGSVAVVDDGDTLVGLITETDFLDLAGRALRGMPLER